MQLAQRINDHFEYIKPFVNCLLGLIPADKAGKLNLKLINFFDLP